jgi:hypothetical protein
MANHKRTENYSGKKTFPIPNILNRCQIFDQVKNPITGDYFQLETLKNAGAVPYNFTLPPGYENKKFLIITVACIIRLRTIDCKEWLKSRQTYQGLDRVGNIVSKRKDDQEVYDKPIWQYSTHQ